MIPIPIAALLQAAGVFKKQEPQPQKDFVIFTPEVVDIYKRIEWFEPLSSYIDKVKPYDGEVGRYDVGGRKIRIIQAKELKED